jgi:hypothetical protein
MQRVSRLLLWLFVPRDAHLLPPPTFHRTLQPHRAFSQAFYPIVQRPGVDYRLQLEKKAMNCQIWRLSRAPNAIIEMRTSQVAVDK